MHAEQLVAQYLSQGGGVTAEVVAALSQPEARQQLYKALLAKPRQAFRGLLRHLLQEEIDFRNALWNGEAEDEGDFYEGIYKCAFLLYGCGNPSDTLALWKAKHINMDVGTSMGAEYFVGAGLREGMGKRAC